LVCADGTLGPADFFRNQQSRNVRDQCGDGQLTCKFVNSFFETRGLAPSVDQELLIDLLIGPIGTRLLITRHPITAHYVDSIVAAVLTGFDVRRATGTSSAAS